MMKFFAVLALAFVGLLPVPAEAQIITDAAGRTVSVPDKINHILVAGPPAAVLVYVLAPEKLVGWVHAPDDAAKAYLMPSVRALPTIGRLTGKDGMIGSQAMTDAKPDIILDAGTVDPTYKALADKVQAETHIPYVLIDGSFGRTGDTIRDVGALIGVEDRANKLADYAEFGNQGSERQAGDVAERSAAARLLRPRRRWPGDGIVRLDDLEILDVVGTMNVAAAAGKGGLTKVTPQQVVGWNPDIIIADDPNFAASVRSDPQWAGIKAVKDGKISCRRPCLSAGLIRRPASTGSSACAGWKGCSIRSSSGAISPAM